MKIQCEPKVPNVNLDYVLLDPKCIKIRMEAYTISETYIMEIPNIKSSGYQISVLVKYSVLPTIYPATLQHDFEFL